VRRARRGRPAAFRNVSAVSSAAHDRQTAGSGPALARAEEEDALLRLAQLARDFSAERIAAHARDLLERVSEGRFYVACLGQFKRGKSTLLNALVAHNVLPVGVVPVTTVPTILRFGERLSARVRYQSGQWAEIPAATVEEFVSEEHNPENRKQAVVVEIFVPSPLLASGMCLADTPGLGSVFAGNAAATRAFLPHIDAALMVIGADPPLSGEELQIAETVSQQVQHLIVVLNKADRTSNAERASAIAFARRLLSRRLTASPAIFEVSALERLAGSGPQRDWPALLGELHQLVEHSGRLLVRQAAVRGLRQVAEQLLAVLCEERAALERPLEESQSRVCKLQQLAATAEQSMLELGYLLSAEQQRLSARFEQRRNCFLTQARAAARQELDATLAALPHRFGPSFRRQAIAAAREIARAQLRPWLAVEQRAAEEGYRAIAQRFIDLTNDYLARVRGAAGTQSATLPAELEFGSGLRTGSRFYFHTLEELFAPRSPFRWLGDALLGLLGVERIVAAEAADFLDRLLETNATRVQNDVDERVLESRRLLEAEIRAAIRGSSQLAERALEHARAAQSAGAAAVEAALSSLLGAEGEVRALASLARDC
jgi:Dynamin family